MILNPRRLWERWRRSTFGRKARRREAILCREGGSTCKRCQALLDEGRNPYTGELLSASAANQQRDRLRRMV